MTFISYYRPYLGWLGADLLCAGIVSAATLAIPLCARVITQDVLSESSPRALRGIALWGAIMLGLVALRTAAEFFVDYRGHLMGAMMESDMRRDLFDHYQALPFSFYDDQDAVIKDLSLTIGAGDYVALVGSSGVGKSTLCALIPRFYAINAGEILIDGTPIHQMALGALRRAIGVVQQDVYLFNGTVADNIRYGKPDATHAEIMAAAQAAHAHEFIIGLSNGYDTHIGQRGVKLSGGQKQRLSIARVFLKDPPIIIFDEATSSLDTHSERAVQHAIETLTANRTMVVIAHRLSTIRNAQRIIVLNGAGIAEQGTHDQLMAHHGIYANLYINQARL